MSSYFKKLFENYEEQPSPEMWDKVLSDVKRHNTIVKARKIGVTTAIVVAGGIAAIMLLRNGAETPATNQMAAAQQEVALPAANAQAPVADVAEQPTVEVEQQTAKTVATAKTTASKVEKTAVPSVNANAKAAKPEPTAAANQEKTVASTPTVGNNTVSKSADNAVSATGTTTTAVAATTTTSATKKPSATNVASKTNPDTNTVVTDNPVKVQIPTAITPDKSENNIFSVTFNHPELVKSYELSIFTRNGLMVFHSKDINQGWDGKYKGRVQNMGAYAYVLIYTTGNGQRQVEKGTVTIVR